ncbi:Uncharacterized protein dnm_078910 [Desulfonema magnum]|uniref:Uncharacterized protein n=1 Tax=Desulfonema magnum TaxID=45655 RepID=A0A975BUN1_9BACT|nr:Uncharacterized protein dnm_078910 [Desulfonema magnum]
MPCRGGIFPATGSQVLRRGGMFACHHNMPAPAGLFTGIP